MGIISLVFAVISALCIIAFGVVMVMCVVVAGSIAKVSASEWWSCSRSKRGIIGDKM